MPVNPTTPPAPLTPTPPVNQAPLNQATPAISITPPVAPTTPAQPTNPELEEDNKKKKIIAISIIVIAFLILAGLIYFMFLAPVPEESALIAQEPQQQEQLPQAQEVMSPRERLSAKQDITEDDLKRLAASFVERYGTYSNQSGYSNINDLTLFMSRSMQSWADNFIQQRRDGDVDNSIYYGLVTKSVVVETVNFNNSMGDASFTVKTQREEAVGSPNNTRSFQQEAEVIMVKEGGIWKVETVTWSE